MTQQRDLFKEPQIGLLGDVHGNFDHFRQASTMMHTIGIKLIVQLGDFGMVWNRERGERPLDQLDKHLFQREQTLLFVDGNHENFDLLHEYPISEDGIRWIRPNIGHLPRGFRTKLDSGRTLAVLGGANSVDVRNRVPGRSWWEQEQITEADLQRLGNEHADILLSHDAPKMFPALDDQLRRTDRFWNDDVLRYSHRGREMFYRGFLQVGPHISVGGHFHLHLDQQVTFATTQGAFTCRVIVLDREGRARGNCAVLTPGPLEIEILDLNGLPFPRRES